MVNTSRGKLQPLACLWPKSAKGYNPFFGLRVRVCEYLGPASLKSLDARTGCVFTPSALCRRQATIAVGSLRRTHHAFVALHGTVRTLSLFSGSQP